MSEDDQDCAQPSFFEGCWSVTWKLTNLYLYLYLYLNLYETVFDTIGFVSQAEFWKGMLFTNTSIKVDDKMLVTTKRRPADCRSAADRQILYQSMDIRSKIHD